MHPNCQISSTATKIRALGVRRRALYSWCRQWAFMGRSMYQCANSISYIRQRRIVDLNNGQIRQGLSNALMPHLYLLTRWQLRRSRVVVPAWNKLWWIWKLGLVLSIVSGHLKAPGPAPKKDLPPWNWRIKFHRKSLTSPSPPTITTISVTFSTCKMTNRWGRKAQIASSLFRRRPVQTSYPQTMPRLEISVQRHLSGQWDATIRLRWRDTSPDQMKANSSTWIRVIWQRKMQIFVAHIAPQTPAS